MLAPRVVLVLVYEVSRAADAAHQIVIGRVFGSTITNTIPYLAVDAGWSGKAGMSIFSNVKIPSAGTD